VGEVNSTNIFSTDLTRQDAALTIIHAHKLTASLAGARDSERGRTQSEH